MCYGHVPIELDSMGDWPIFCRLRDFEIGGSPADFVDLEQCCKLTQRSPDDRHRETVRPPANFLLK